jgi:glucose-6-phosphate dehydrogenase assembly protein OpcA
MQVPIEATLDVQGVERQLNELWMQNAGAAEGSEEGAMLRARVLNLMVYLTDGDALREVDEMLMDIALVHPCRALLMFADEDGAEKDIEMNVASRCQLGGGAGGQHLCCEQVTLRAGGQFIAELPSASVPLLVSDLPVFLWWRAKPRFEDQIWKSLIRAADRVIIDSAMWLDPIVDLRSFAQFMSQSQGSNPGQAQSHGVSDLNWARLTTWRTLLASFYDAPEHVEPLSHVIGVRIDYVAPEAGRESIAPKALLLAGWLASRLGWRVSKVPGRSVKIGQLFTMETDGRTIDIEFRPSEHRAVRQGGITRVELIVESETHKSFVAMRADDCRDLETREASDSKSRTTRVVSSADKSEAALLAAELEILSHDHIYEDAVAKVAEMLRFE